MIFLRHSLYVSLLWLHYVATAVLNQQHTFKTPNSDTITNLTYINLRPFLNNKGASDFDGAGNYFKCSLLENTITMGGISYKPSTHNNYDNIVSLGQIITLPKETYGGIYLLGAINHGPITADIIIVYEDGSETTTVLNIPDWQVRHSQQIERLDVLPCRINNGFIASLASIPLLVDPSKPVSYLVLPYTHPIGSFQPSLHIFGMTAIPAKEKGIHVISAKGTRRWWESSQREYQIITVKVHNTSPNWVSDLSIFIEGSLLKTKYHGNIKRLAPGHIMTIDVAILTLRKKREPTQILIEVVDVHGKEAAHATVVENVEIGLEDFQATQECVKICISIASFVNNFFIDH